MHWESNWKRQKRKKKSVFFSGKEELLVDPALGEKRHFWLGLTEPKDVEKRQNKWRQHMGRCHSKGSAK